MSVNPQELLAIAEELSDSSSEIRLRTSINRSYYAVYHACLAHIGVCDTRDWVGGKGGSHEKLCDTFIYDVDKAVGFMLQNMKSKRHLADYDLLNDEIDQSIAKSMVVSARRILDKISKET